MPVGHKGSVGEDREHDVFHLSCRLYHVPSEHGLAAGKQYEADAELLSLPEDLHPFLFSQLHRRGAVCCSVICARIASLTVQIAARSDARDQI